ncbi:serine/threonine-protein kinase [Nonomuraea maritima]|uniref:serine/threonine-protein kinase n=1 Tax=Nonomuraea maritima TaxID=683260 RepID=UPI00371B0EB3
MRPLTVGDPVVIGRYLLLGRLGTGGMGVVYLAEHPQGGLVALKTPHAVHLHDATLRARFAEEVAFSRRLVPFCTAAVIEDGSDRGRPYLVTEYIPGPALSQVVLAGGPLTPDLAYGVALGVAAALVAVHEAGLVHRDLKPGNVLLSPDGPRVIDFGIARDLDTAGAHTQAGQVMGSPGWVAPERLTGGAALPSSDVFAWGCVVAFAATGHHPFGGGEPDVLTRRILFEPPRLDGVPAVLRPAVQAALAKEPADRPRAAELLRALLAAGGVAEPWDLRRAVDDVLAAAWTPVPHPPGSEPDVERSEGRRRRARAGAQLSHASFAALATVSMAAITVVAASGGDGLGMGGALFPDGAPARTYGTATVDPARQRPDPEADPEADAGAYESTEGGAYEGTDPTAASTVRPFSATPQARPTARAARTAAVPDRTSVLPGVVVTRPLEPPFAASTPPRRGRPVPPPRTSGPRPGPGDGCVTPAGRGRGGSAGRPDCPRPSVPITTIPQDGPGESLPPTPTPTDPTPPTPTPTP